MLNLAVDFRQVEVTAVDAKQFEKLLEQAGGLSPDQFKRLVQAYANGGGTLVEEMELAGVILRHEAKKGETRPELSGHFHPRIQIHVRQRRIVRPCAVISANENADGSRSGRMILPAFGALTAGMSAADPAILKALQPARSIDAAVSSSRAATKRRPSATQ